jgi:hypothetical protein
VVATDPAGNPSTASPVTVGLDATKPMVTLTSPVNKLATNTAGVTVAGTEIAGIGRGLLALVAFAPEDSQEELEWMARKIAEVRIFDDAEGRLNRSLLDIGGQLLPDFPVKFPLDHADYYLCH